MQASLDNNQIILSFPFSPTIVQFIRTLDGRRFNKTDRTWTVPVSTMTDEKLKNLAKLGFSVDPAINDAIKRDLSRAKELEGISSRPDVSFETSLPLYPFQRVVSAWIDKAGSCVNACDVRTGKTLMTLAVLRKRETQRVIIVCPKSVMYAWQNECKHWLNRDVAVVSGNKAARDELYAKAPRWLITNYDLARIDIAALAAVDYDALVCDEAHRLSGFTKTRKALKQIKTPLRLLLTATPIQNKLVDVWGLLDFIQPGSMGSYQSFLQKHCYRDRYGNILSYTNTEELQNKIKRYVIRKTLAEAAPEMPPAIEEDLVIEFSEREQKLYDRLRSELLFEIDRMDISKINDPTTLQMTIVKTGKLLELCDSMELLGESQESSKLAALKEHLADNLQDNKALVFTKYRRMAGILVRELSEYNPLTITGQTQKRQEVIGKFQAGNDHKVLVMTEAGGEGLTLSRASLVYHYDLPWSVSKAYQRTGRALALEKREPIISYSLLVKGAADMFIRRVLHKKQLLSEKILMSDIREMLM